MDDVHDEELLNLLTPPQDVGARSEQESSEKPTKRKRVRRVDSSSSCESDGAVSGGSPLATSSPVNDRSASDSDGGRGRGSAGFAPTGLRSPTDILFTRSPASQWSPVSPRRPEAKTLVDAAVQVGGPSERKLEVRGDKRVTISLEVTIE